MGTADEVRHYRTDVKVGDNVIVWTDEGRIIAKLLELGYEWAKVQFFPPRRRQRIYFTKRTVNDRGDTIAVTRAKEIDKEGIAEVPAEDLRPV